ncbi:hypothetical protein LX70_00807 [Defluviimonas denitrificans]|uniref:Uncharacterized protein n=1 Tax=Albidovulum denitrificans TaxID=404881 RepID=A0A2S8SDR0_9RHOB|nr:hypothetical protein LX70_00807 [Defluviimonas denitrificans]
MGRGVRRGRASARSIAPVERWKRRTPGLQRPGRGRTAAAARVRGPEGKGPVDLSPVRLPEGASRRARGYRVAPCVCHRGAPAWGEAGSETVRWTVSRSNARPRRAGRERAERACRGVMRDQQRSSGPLSRRTPRPWRGWWQARPDLSKGKSGGEGRSGSDLKKTCVQTRSMHESAPEDISNVEARKYIRRRTFGCLNSPAQTR